MSHQHLSTNEVQRLLNILKHIEKDGTVKVVRNIHISHIIRELEPNLKDVQLVNNTCGIDAKVKVNDSVIYSTAGFILKNY